VDKKLSSKVLFGFGSAWIHNTALWIRIELKCWIRILTVKSIRIPSPGNYLDWQKKKRKKGEIPGDSAELPYVSFYDE
jgi:hypothetical protein